MQDSQLVESYKFFDVMQLWARERLVHEVLVSQELARGFVSEGLRFQSVDPKWLTAQETFRGQPYVGYVALPGDKPVCIRAPALEHLLAVARAAADPDRSLLSEEYVSRGDFQRWLVHTGRPFPAFWFGAEERAVEAQPAAPAAGRVAVDAEP